MDVLPMYLGANEPQDIEPESYPKTLTHNDTRFVEELIDETDSLHNSAAYFNKLRKGLI